MTHTMGAVSRWCNGALFGGASMVSCKARRVDMHGVFPAIDPVSRVNMSADVQRCFQTLNPFAQFLVHSITP